MKKTVVKIGVICLALLALRGTVHALDFGALLSEQFSAEGSTDTALISKTLFAPWLSARFGAAAALNVSAGFTVDYRSDREDMRYIPEFFRLEASFKPLPGLAINAGRIAFQDISQFTVKGRFDGLSASIDAGSSTLKLGAYYTGFLYKGTASIKASPADQADYAAPLDYADFAGTYFAPPRLIAAVQGEFPGFIAERGTLRAGLLGQMDFSEADIKLHSQYLLLRYNLALRGGLDFALTGSAEMEESGDKLSFAAAGSFDAGWLLPGKLPSRISLGCRWASGEGETAAYFPIIEESQGSVLKPYFSGLMVIRAGCDARLASPLSVSLDVRYFLRTDRITFIDPDISGDSYVLGGELSGSVLWVPLSDLSFSLSGGAFVPQTGTAFRSDAPVRWFAALGTIFSF